MTTLQLIGLDLLAILVLTFGLYVPRHRRRSLVVAFLTVNVAVAAVTIALAETSIDMGVGLGLFGILSIIRLRSSELDQHEIAYYFAALALGLLTGFGSSIGWLTPALMGAILAALYVGDHPALLPRYQSRTVVLDDAFVDNDLLARHLEQRLGATVHRVEVKKVDFVNRTTSVEVRLEVPRTASPALETIDDPNAPIGRTR